MHEQVLKAALAGLLHDVGKFAQRAGWRRGKHAEVGASWIEHVSDLFPREMWEDLADAAAEHHHSLPRKRIAKVVRLADQFAASERCTKNVPRSDPAATPLVPILAQLELTGAGSEEKWGFDLNALETDSLFPQPGLEAVDDDRYADLWGRFGSEVKALKRAGIVADRRHFTSLLFLLQKYLAFVPSATPWEEDEERTLPDVSLYDHLKVTAAISACLERGLSDDDLDQLLHRDEMAWQEPVAVMVRGDLSGIQDFIYRVTRPAGDTTFRGVAKRLRGRSFYLALLGDVVGDWLVRELGLTSANLLFCGGGRFDLLIPKDKDSKQKLALCRDRLESWLLEMFYGELGIQCAMEAVTPADFADMSRIYAALEQGLVQSKAQKWKSQVHREGFFVSTKDEYHACPVCQLTPVDEPRICPLCEQHHQIGSKLPDTSWIAYDHSGADMSEGAGSVSFEHFNTVVHLMDDAQIRDFIKRREQRPTLTVLYRLNDTDFIPTDMSRDLGLGFRFLANTAPVALETIERSGHEPTAPGDVLDFDEIAELGTGAKRLGVLKADLDHLGLLFSDGLEPLTISRQAALSHAVDRFFGGWLNRLCDKVFASWQEGLGKDHPWKTKVGSFFYVMYSGGDDMLVVGPWDQILELAQQLRADFTEYVCRNPNVTLSAGVIQVKPHYPVQRFAQLVGQRLNKAKGEGRNRVNVFDHSVVWHDEWAGRGFKWLLEFAHALCKRVDDGQMPRTLVHDIGRLYRKHLIRENDQVKPMWAPELSYTLARRLRREVREELQKDIFTAIVEQTILVPVDYVSLSTRRE